MRYVAAYLLAALGGKDNPNGSDIKKILESVGIEADETRMQKVKLNCSFGVTENICGRSEININGIGNCCIS